MNATWFRVESMTETDTICSIKDPSIKILRKPGFKNVATLQHPEDGPVWEWRPAPSGITID